MTLEWIFTIAWCIASLTIVFTVDLWIDTKFGKAFQNMWDSIVRVTAKLLGPLTRK